MSENKKTPNSQQEVKQEEAANVQDKSTEIVNGFTCPVDPQALLECEACQ